MLRLRWPKTFRARLTAFVVIGAALVLLAGGGFAALESDSVATYWQGLWWALSLMTTVGFVGDAPTTGGGRIISAVLMLSGFALMSLTTAAIASLFVGEEAEPAEAKERAFERELLAAVNDLSDRLRVIERAVAVDPAGPRRDGRGA